MSYGELPCLSIAAINFCRMHGRDCTIARMNVLDLLSSCESVYKSAGITAGPLGRDGASVTRFGRTTILAFRGTTCSPNAASLDDWLNDFRAELVLAEGFPGRVHAGFLASLNDLWHGVFAAINSTDTVNEAAPWNTSLYITGHSKGGALAQLAGVRLAALKPCIVTFASPRVGNRQFASLYPLGIDVTRYEGAMDVVPILPPFGYHGAGRPVVEDMSLPFLRAIDIGEEIGEGKWSEIASEHHLCTYRTWIEKLPPKELILPNAA